MLTQNEPVGGFVNGDIGKVIGFRHATEEELQKRVDEKKPLEPGEPARRYPIVQFHRTCKNGGNTRLIMPANRATSSTASASRCVVSAAAARRPSRCTSLRNVAATASG